MFGKRDQDPPPPKDDQIVERLLGPKNGESNTVVVKTLSSFERLLRTFGVIVGTTIICFSVFCYL